MRLNRIGFSARKALMKTSNALKYLHFYSKTWAKNDHPAGREFETPATEALECVIPLRTSTSVESPVWGRFHLYLYLEIVCIRMLFPSATFLVYPTLLNPSEIVQVNCCHFVSSSSGFFPCLQGTSCKRQAAGITRKRRHA